MMDFACSDVSRGRARKVAPRGVGLGALCLVAVALLGRAAGAAERFEAAAWVDHFDFAAVSQQGRYLYDTETAAGCAALLDHVAETGATQIWWRNCAGATLRYASAEDTHHQDAPLDKRRVPSNVPVHGWVRYGEVQPDLLRSALACCRERGLRPGIHWPFEETHWQGFTIGGWNLEHPQFWGRTYDGQPWCGRSSLAYEEVVQHKLRLIDELLDRGAQTIYVDTSRNGGWSPAYEYVDPVVAAYRKAYGAPPPADSSDLRWCRHVAGYTTRYLRRVRERLDRSGRKVELAVGVADIAPLSDRCLVAYGCDWRSLVDQGVIDLLVINSVNWEAKAPLESTRALYREVLAAVGGRCKVFCPVQAYDFSHRGLPSYVKTTGLPQEEIAAQLVRIAWEEGAAGVSLECVDYNNYSPATRKALHELLSGECQWRRPAAK